MNLLIKVKKTPITLVCIIMILCIIGFVTLYSAADGNIYPWAYKQIIIFLICLPIMLGIISIDIDYIFRFSYIFYVVIILLLLSVELFGSSAMGAKRWIDFGFFRVQPSELVKLAIILMLSKYFNQFDNKDLSLIKIIPPILGVLLPVILILKQPDLGTSIITILIASSIFFIVYANIKIFFIIGMITVGSIPIIWNLMHDYQKKRLIIFLDPTIDPFGAGYNIIQSKIAIGSGGILGKGFTKGTQNKLSFLPEHQTDFIFGTFAEEFGFIGSIILLMLYAMTIIICLIISVSCKSTFSKLTVIGISTMLFVHVFINIGMVMGLIPVVGVPLPFISYGGTMLASMLIGFAIVMNIKINQHKKLK